MFAARYFGPRYFAPRFFPKTGQDQAVVTSLDGLTTMRLLTKVGR